MQVAKRIMEIALAEGFTVPNTQTVEKIVECAGRA